MKRRDGRGIVRGYRWWEVEGLGESRGKWDREKTIEPCRSISTSDWLIQGQGEARGKYKQVLRDRSTEV